MARFKPVHKGLKLLPVDFERQLLPGTFEHALSYLVNHELDLSELEARYRNDYQGASAYAPAALLKIVLLAYSRGIIGSRRIEAACRENVLFMTPKPLRETGLRWAVANSAGFAPRGG